MKIVIMDGHALNPGDMSYAVFAQFGELTVHPYGTESEEEVVRRIGDAEIIILNKVPITRAVLQRCPKLKLICVMATGYNVVDVAAARALGIGVCNVPAYGTQMVAQYTIGLLLELCHHTAEHSASVHAGDWCRSPDFCYWRHPLTELAGKTMGIIGFGRIGRAVGAIARALGMQVLTTGSRECPEGQAIGEYVSLETLLQRSDVVSLHCPLLPQTYRLINEETLALMKPGAILLNTGRGDLIDEEAVTSALEQGKLSAAAMDVVSREPMAADNPLLRAPNCIITPHIAWAARECRQRVIDTTEANIRAFLSGAPQNLVN